VRTEALRATTLGLALAGLALGACSFELGDTPPPGGHGIPNPGTGEDGGTPAAPVPDGTTIAYLETRVPSTTHFLLRGTIPIAPGTFPRPDGLDPFQIHDHDGSALKTQTEIVTRYANAAEGADVVEVMAWVQRPPTANTDDQIQYEVRQVPQEPFPGPQPAALDKLDDTLELPADVLALLGDANGLEIATYDCYGNKYVVRPFDGTGNYKLMRHGPVRTELRIAQTMQLEGPALVTPLPHAFGVHTYVSTFQGRKMLGLDLRLHNGHSGHDSGTSLDDPLDKIYFDRIEVSIPSNWFLDQAYRDPFFNPTPSTGGGRNAYKLVRSIGNGYMHVMRWQGQFHRRLAISTAGSESTDYRDPYLQSHGQAFAVREHSGGGVLWSWWNRGTSRYFPQNYQLPLLDHVGLGSVRTQLYNSMIWIQGHLQNGSCTGGENCGDYPVGSISIGWGHPYGVAYGGMTGGAEIHLFEGLETVTSASPWGYRHLHALHRMHTDRHPATLYNGDGNPSTIEDWLVENGNNDYVPFHHFLTPSIGSNDPFGFGQAPQTQNSHIATNGLQPWYENTHFNFDPHDYQHFIRYTRGAKALIWLGNDSIAKDDILMQAENFNLSYHPYANNAGGGAQGTGMKTDRDFVDTYPGIGYATGRGESWGTDAMITAYAIGNNAWRVRKLPWFRDLATLLSDGQSTCNGFIQSQHMGSVPIPQQLPTYFWRQLIEQAITENMLQSLRETVFKRADAGFSDLVRDTLMGSGYAMLSPMAWELGQAAPWQYTAVGMNPDAGAPQPSTVWCSAAEAPANAHTPSVDRYQNWSSFAYGFELTDDDLFMTCATAQGNGPNLYNYLRDEGLENLQNRAALLALVQRQNGDFD
jgi:hypothetical protein